MVIVHGILRDFDGTGYTAVVEALGSPTSWVTVAVARNIDAAEMTNGRQVAVLFFDAGNPEDGVLIAVWT